MLKNINWKVRLKNPTFWAQIVIAIVSPILVGLGLQWQDMTTWAALWDALCNAVSNPVIVVSASGRPICRGFLSAALPAKPGASFQRPRGSAFT